MHPSLAAILRHSLAHSAIQLGYHIRQVLFGPRFEREPNVRRDPQRHLERLGVQHFRLLYSLGMAVAA
jgi:hypothetical protein